MAELVDQSYVNQSGALWRLKDRHRNKTDECFRWNDIETSVYVRKA